MRIGELLYFAPGVPFHDLQIESHDIVGKFQKRIEEYYLTPAQSLIQQSHAFAATVVIVSAMDALTYHAPASANFQWHNERFIAWLQAEMAELFPNEIIATRFYKDIRCGAVHEGRIKRGCIFDLMPARAIWIEDGIMAVNPKHLIGPVAAALKNFCDETVADVDKLIAFQDTLKKDFGIELNQ